MKLLILDRDGVINEDSDHYIKSADEWVPIPGSLEAIAQANRQGWTVAVATNQSGIARKFYDLATLNSMHAKMNALLALHGGKIAHIAFCPHVPADNCSCRKPAPGLLLQIKSVLSIQAWPDKVWMVGDSLSDLQAGLSQSIPVALVLTGKGKKTLDKLDRISGTVPVFKDLAEFVSHSLD